MVSTYGWMPRTIRHHKHDASKRTLYASEHGQLGGDELNVVLAVANYDWPVFSYGFNYDRTSLSGMSEDAARAISILRESSGVQTIESHRRASSSSAARGGRPASGRRS